MNRLSLKYYPPAMFIGLLLIFLTMTFTAKKYLAGAEWHEIRTDALIIISTSSVLGVMVYLCNKFGMYMHLNKLMGIPDMRGLYKGDLVSSYFVDDEKNNGHVVMNFSLTVEQNLNGCHVTGTISNKNSDETSSNFFAKWTDISPGEGESYYLMYLYMNQPNMKHPDYEKHELQGHEGFCELSYYPKTKTLKGTYFNCKRNSYGQVDLKKTAKTIL